MTISTDSTIREIKFKAWHKLAHKICDIDALDWMLDGYRAHAGRMSGSGHLTDIILMQWTGLKDKNGVEIYEGYIIRYLDNTSKGLIEKTVVIEDIRYLPDFRCSKWLEVIGNIWETPELLTTREVA